MISELTEITEAKEAVASRGWIFYERDCRFCRELVARFENVFAKRGFLLEPLQHSWVQERLNLNRDEALQEMRVLTVEGETFGGIDAVIFLAREIWWTAPLWLIARLPGIHRLLDLSYRWIAAHRSCAVGRAERPKFPARMRWLGLAILPALALATRPNLSAWAFMWLMALAIFFGCKWLTLGRAINRAGHVSPSRAIAYLLAWPGMEAARFLSPEPARVLPPAIWRTAALALLRIALGLFLLFAVARRIPEPLLSGWIGMTGMILVLHFGLFALASLGWRMLGVDARPIMDHPFRSTSTAEFWGRRWNGAFNDLALGLVFRPIARRGGIAVATLVAFAVSGLIHELVISLPARGGYGLPTAYFFLQGFAILIGRKYSVLREGISGWFFTMIVVAAPAYWLFHPPFVRNVILSFMEVIGAL